MKSLMKKDCRYLLDAFLVDNEKFGGKIIHSVNPLPDDKILDWLE